MDGYGTDAVLYLQTAANSATERLPVYNELDAKKIYDAHLAADDWTT